MKTSLFIAGSKSIFILIIAVMEAVLIGLSLIISIEQFSDTSTEIEIKNTSPSIQFVELKGDKVLLSNFSNKSDFLNHQV